MSKKRKRKSRRNDLTPSKQVETEGVDFLPFMAGMITSLAIVFLTWNQIANAWKTESEDAIGTSIAAEEELDDSDDFEAVVASGDPDRLVNLLLELKQTVEDLKLNERVKVNRQCIRIADQLLTNKLSPEQELFAKESKLDSLSRNYGLHYIYQLDTPDVVDDLRVAAESYLQETNPRLVRKASLALFKLNAFGLAGSRLPSSNNSTADEIVGLLNQYPADEFVINTIRLTSEVCLNQNQKFGAPLIEELFSRLNEIDSANAQRMIQDLSDKVLIAKARYEKLFDDRWVNGSVGQRELLNVSQDLIRHQNAGPLLFSKVDEVAHWFEQEDRYGDAIKIYETMLRAADRHPNVEAATLARETANAGLRRNNLVNQKIELTGLKSDGSLIQPHEFEQRTVVVIFWSFRNATSISELHRLYRETSSWISKPIDVLVVCVDDNADDKLKDLAAELVRFKFIISDPARGEALSLLEQCPSSRVPRAMLIGRDGRVIDVNVPTEELKTDAEGV